MNRRDWIGAMVSAGALAAGASAAHAQTSSHDIHRVSEASPVYGELVTAASHCVATGNACLSHCLNMLAQGDRELAACARTVRDMLAACAALQELAAAESPHLKAFAQLVSQVCADCEAECHKHEQHTVCRNCEQSCHDCKAACDRVSAA